MKEKLNEQSKKIKERNRVKFPQTFQPDVDIIVGPKTDGSELYRAVLSAQKDVEIGDSQSGTK